MSQTFTPRATAETGEAGDATEPGEGVVAFENRCLHQSSPLAGGMVRDGILICPAHFWRYRLPAGRQVATGTPLPRYPTELVDGEVWVELPDPEPVASMRELLLRHARDWRPQT